MIASNSFISTHRTLLPYLDLYSLVATIIPHHTFLSNVHCSAAAAADAIVSMEREEVEVAAFDSVYLMSIRRQQDETEQLDQTTS